MYISLESSCLESSGLPRPECLFLFFRFPVIFLQISFWLLFLFLPSGTPIMPILFCLILSHRTLNCLHFLKFFFLFSALFRWVLLPCLLDHWSFLLLHLVCCWTPLIHFSVQLLYSSALWLLFDTFLYFLFVDLIPVFIHFSPKFVEHLYNHYFEFFVRYVTYLCFIKVFSEVLFSSFIWKILFCIFILLDCLCLFLCIRQDCYHSQSEGGGLVYKMSLIIQPCPSSWLPCKPFWLSKQRDYFERFLLLRVWQDLSLFQRKGSQLAPRFRLIGSQTLKRSF